MAGGDWKRGYVAGKRLHCNLKSTVVVAWDDRYTKETNTIKLLSLQT